MSVFRVVTAIDVLEVILSAFVIALNIYVIVSFCIHKSIRRYAIAGLVILMVVNDTITVLGLQERLVNRVRMEMNLTIINEQECFGEMGFSIFAYLAYNIVFIFWVQDRWSAVYKPIEYGLNLPFVTYRLVFATLVTFVLGFGNIIIAYALSQPSSVKLSNGTNCDSYLVMTSGHRLGCQIFTTSIDVIVYIGIGAIIYWRRRLAKEKKSAPDMIQTANSSVWQLEPESRITAFVVGAVMIHFLCTSGPSMILFVMKKLENKDWLPDQTHARFYELAHLLHIIEPVFHGWAYMKKIQYLKQRNHEIKTLLIENTVEGFKRAQMKAHKTPDDENGNRRKHPFPTAKRVLAMHRRQTESNVSTETELTNVVKESSGINGLTESNVLTVQSATSHRSHNVIQPLVVHSLNLI